jgi:hypothetical protein
VPPIIGCPTIGPPYSEVTGAICRVPSTSFAQSPWYFDTCPPVSVSGTVLLLELFPGTPSSPIQSNKDRQVTVSVTTSRFRNINLIPIDYAFRPRLRGRLTLRGLTWRRNPWTFGGHASHMPYTLLMSAFALLLPPESLTGTPSQAYRTLRYRVRGRMSSDTRSFGVWF